MRRITLIAIVMPVLIAGLGAAQASGDVVKVVSDCVHAHYEPTKIVLACDRSITLTKITYKSWGVDRAKGSDRTVTNDCVPSCAAGSVTEHNDHFVLYRPKTRKGVLVFTVARLYTDKYHYQTYPLAVPNQGIKVGTTL